MILSRCEDCNHRNICKYREEYEKVLREITVKVPDPFTLVLNCKHYYSTTCYLSGCTSGDSNWTTSCSNTALDAADLSIPRSPEVFY